MRIGILGYGVWARKALARNIAKHMDIAWVVDPSAEARAAARQDGYTCVAAPDWDAVDAAAIATPIATHALIAEEALQHGKHVLCEKPLALTGREAQSLADTASVRGCVLYTDFTWTHHAAIQRGAQVARELGKPLWFSFARTSWDERELDPIADLLPHDVAILKLWTRQRVTEVSAAVNGGTASVTLATNGAVIASGLLSYRDHVKRRTVVLGCESGHLQHDGGEGLYVQDQKSLGSKFAQCSGPEPLDAMCAEFVRRVKMKECGNTAEAVEISRVIEAAHLSVAERRVVRL